MAETISSVANTVFGNYRLVVQRVTNGANSSTADVATGLTYVEFGVVQPLFGSASGSFAVNQTNAGTSTAGTVAYKSGTSAGSYIFYSFGY